MDVVLGEMTLSGCGDEEDDKEVVVTIGVGEKVKVRFADTDGEVAVSYDERALQVTADLEDDQGRKGVIYEEVWRRQEVWSQGVQECEERDGTKVTLKVEDKVLGWRAPGARLPGEEPKG